MKTAFPTTADRSFMPAVRDSGTRPKSAIQLVVVHQTQGPSARSAAQWFQNPAAQGSAHTIGDGDELYRSLSDDTIAWGVAGYNTPALHHEMAGSSSWIRSVWLHGGHKRMMKQAAWRVAKWLVEFDLPPKYRGKNKLNAGKTRGWTTHRALSLSSLSTSTHTDPGIGFPRRRFGRMVKRYHKDLTHGGK